MSRWLTRLFAPEAVFFLAAWLGLQWAFQTRAFNDPGALWHVRVGERILADGFMTTDPFTYTFAGHTWIPQQWGGEVLMALAHSAAGLDAMLLAFSAGVAGLFTWVFSRMVRGGMHPLLAAVVSGGAGVVAAFHFYARPHMFTIAGMAVVMAAVVDFERGRATLWRLWWMIPLCAIWTNIHGGVLGGVLTLGMAVAGLGVCLAVRRFAHLVLRRPSFSPPYDGGAGGGGLGERSTPPVVRGGEEPVAPSPPTPLPQGERGASGPIKSWRTAFLLAAIVAACALTPFVNPFGMEMLVTWKKIVGSSAMKELVSEHQPLSLANTAGQVVVGFAAFYLLMLAGTLPKWPRVSWLLPLVWLVFSVQSIRQGPLFVVAAAVAVADLWPHTVWFRLLKRYGDSLARDVEAGPRGWWWTVIPAVIVLAAFGAQLAGVKAPLVGRGWAGLDAQANPVQLRDALDEYARAAPPGARLFNDANLGGFVIYHAPAVKVFMDDRFELYGDTWLRDYKAVVYDEPERFERWADEYRFDHALVAVVPGADRVPLEKYLSESPRWVVVSRCESGALFRRLPPNATP